MAQDFRLETLNTINQQLRLIELIAVHECDTDASHYPDASVPLRTVYDPNQLQQFLDKLDL
jgi:hypothetical protein